MWDSGMGRSESPAAVACVYPTVFHHILLLRAGMNLLERYRLRQRIGTMCWIRLCCREGGWAVLLRFLRDVGRDPSKRH